MKKQLAVYVLLLLVSLPSCGRKKKKSTKPTQVQTQVDIPVASDDSIRSFFDNGAVDEFALVDNDKAVTTPNANDFTWVDETNNSEFKVVLFDFDSFDIRKDQEKVLSYDIELAKKKLEACDGALGNDQKPTIVIEGHACHSAGSHIYNLALSEKRAKVQADKYKAAGIPNECIKIVGRGMEMPAVIDGKPVDGDRSQQGPNRRNETKFIYS